MMNNDVKAKNAFVKAEQKVLESMMGDRPKLKPEALRFNAYMCNNEQHVEEFNHKLTKGIDKKAFPVK